MDFDAQTRIFSQPPVKIGVVADTYDNRDGLRRLLDLFLVGGARWLFHCGGLGSANLVDLLKPWQVYIVAGEKERDRQAIELALQKARLQSTLPTSLTTTIEGFRIGLCRGDNMPLVNRWAKSGEFDYVFYGHSLRRSDNLVGKTRVINPGALGGPRYQSRSGYLIDLVSGEARQIEVAG
ncbi:MAG TPA: metallophosphoesterase family protein [Anaerolineae bacterium]|nr:metallophosphoesterase family protein [Anaerolineae bacterium]